MPQLQARVDSRRRLRRLWWEHPTRVSQDVRHDVGGASRPSVMSDLHLRQAQGILLCLGLDLTWLLDIAWLLDFAYVLDLAWLLT